MVLKDNITCYLDFGMMGVLSTHMREQLAAIIVGIVNFEDFAVVFCLMLSVCGSIQADTVYVATDGNDTAGDVNNFYSYDPFGKVFETETDQTVTNPFMFTGCKINCLYI